MKIKYSPQISNNVVDYSFDNEVISCTVNGETDVFDFGNVPINSMIEVESDLPLNVVLNAKRDADNILWIELYKPISSNASYEDRFPDWIEV